MASQVQVQVPSKKCHNCRRQRLRCDRSYPHCNKCLLAGKECLGYGQLFRWTGAVASRGKLAGKTLSAPSELSPSDAFASPACTAPSETADPDPTASDWVGAGAGAEAGDMELLQAMHPTDLVLSMPWTLVDPLYQDLSHPYRHYLSYCKS